MARRYDQSTTTFSPEGIIIYIYVIYIYNLYLYLYKLTLNIKHIN